MKRGFQFVTLILEFSVVLATSVVRGDGTTLTVGGGPGGPGGTHHTELPSSKFGNIYMLFATYHVIEELSLTVHEFRLFRFIQACTSNSWSGYRTGSC